MIDIFTLSVEEMALKIKEGQLTSIEVCEKYIETVNMNMNKIYKGWWSEILTLDDWRTYER